MNGSTRGFVTGRSGKTVHRLFIISNSLTPILEVILLFVRTKKEPPDEVGLRYTNEGGVVVGDDKICQVPVEPQSCCPFEREQRRKEKKKVEKLIDILNERFSVSVFSCGLEKETSKT